MRATCSCVIADPATIDLRSDPLIACGDGAWNQDRRHHRRVFPEGRNLRREAALGGGKTLARTPGTDVNALRTERPRTWVELRRNWPVLPIYQRFEASVGLALT